MKWWRRKPKEPEVIEIEGKPGEVVPCEDPQNVVLVKKDPPPDSSTKPKNVVGYCFGYVCPKKHVNEPFEQITVDGFGIRRVCQTCGGVTKPATVKRIAEAKWLNKAVPRMYDPNPEPRWGWTNGYAAGLGYTLGWGNYTWTKHMLVHYLDTPRRKK